jgi:hypothetical protein
MLCLCVERYIPKEYALMPLAGCCIPSVELERFLRRGVGLSGELSGYGRSVLCSFQAWVHFVWHLEGRYITFTVFVLWIRMSYWHLKAFASNRVFTPRPRFSGISLKNLTRWAPSCRHPIGECPLQISIDIKCLRVQRWKMKTHNASYRPSVVISGGSSIVALATLLLRSVDFRWAHARRIDTSCMPFGCCRISFCRISQRWLTSETNSWLFSFTRLW